MDFNGGIAREASNQRRFPKGPLKVLVVDDDELIQSAMREILKVLGHAACITASGEEAWPKWKPAWFPTW